MRGVSEPVTLALEAAGIGPETCRVCVNSSLLRSGRFGGAWLAVSPERLAVVEDDAGQVKEVISAPLEHLRGARVESCSGGGSLLVNVDGQQREVLRYHSGSAEVFGAVAKRLNDATAPDDDEAKHTDEGQADPPARDPLAFEELLEKWREAFCPRCERCLPSDTKVCPACVKRTHVLGRVLSFAAPYRLQLMTMMGLMVLGTCLQLVPPQIVRILLDDVLPAEGQPGLGLAVAVLALIMIIQALVGVVRSRMGVRVGSDVTNSIRVQAFQHLQRLSLSYFNKQQTGSLMSRINNDTRQMQSFMVEGIQYTIVNVLLVIGILTAMIWMNPFLGLLVLLPMPLVLLLSALVWKRIFRRFRILWRTRARMSAYLSDALMGVRVIKAFGREAAEEERFAERTGAYRDRLVDAETTWQTLIPLLNLIVQSSLLLIWYFGALEVGGERLTVGGLVAYISYLGLIYGPLQLLTRLNDWLSRALTAAARVFEILDVHADITDASDAVQLEAFEGRIELDEVTFGYEPHEPVIKRLSLEIKAGQMIGLVGRSGAGKSTLINLIGRLYDVDQGAISLDGVDVRKIRLASLRRHVGYVLQETFLFNGSVAENIAYARPGADQGDVVRAAVTANAHEFIMKLRNGYDTVVGERGVELSGGERQRIAIARAILHDPKLLILDEATSSVDTETESKIQAALHELIKGRTTLAIAHRLSTLRHADRLVVMEGGEVKEDGTHEELMQLEEGTYRKLVEIQSEWSQTIGVGG